MANIKSAQKQARKSAKRTIINLTRQTALKTAIKKVRTAVENNEDMSKISQLLAQAEAQIARAKNKGTLHANTASRKISRLAKKVSQSKRQARA
jgi:small subunit ribosomal protein S20